MRRAVTRAGVVRYRLGMKQDLAWLCGLASLALVVACGETSNLLGEDPMDGGSSGSGVGGSTAGSKPNGGATAGGGVSSGGSTSTAGKAPIGGTRDPGKCETREGNWVVCDDGLVHRTVPAACSSILPRAEALPATASGMDECTKDSDCTAKPNGYCSLVQGGFVPVEPHNVCSYGCTSDADCSEKQACRCGDGIGVCVSSSGCGSDRDCGGGLCTQYDTCPGAPTYDFACQAAADECLTDSDCTADPMLRHCSIEVDHRVCVDIQCYADIAP